MNCKNCYWNFDGLCASHRVEKPDTYGCKCKKLIQIYPDGCCNFRESPDFLEEQKQER